MIYLILTATITPIKQIWGPEEKDARKARYQRCISDTLNHISASNLIKPIIVVNDIGVTNSYFDDLGCDVVYASNNNGRYHNKGINELTSIKAVITKYDIKEDDMIIKQTGRYCPCSSSFYDIITEEIRHYDAIAKFYNVCTYQFDDNDCILGLIALKCKYWRGFEYSHDHNGFDGPSPEVEMARYIRENVESNKILSLETLNMEFAFANDPNNLRYF